MHFFTTQPLPRSSSTVLPIFIGKPYSAVIQAELGSADYFASLIKR
jgi:hypothetical protein